MLEQNFLNKENKRFVLPGNVFGKNKNPLEKEALFPMNACQLPK